MKIQRREGTPERRIITALIVDKAALARIAARYDENLFRSKWANLIAKWCVRYYLKYEKAPGKNIEGIFERWAAESRDKETIQLVEKLLQGLSSEYKSARKESNSDYIVDLASDHFNQNRLAKLSEEISIHIENGDTEKAVALAESYGRLEIGQGAGVDVMQDRIALQRAFEHKTEPLIRYKGAAGNFFTDVFERDGFVSFMAPEKRGKTFWLMDVAWMGVSQGRKVAFFEVGDLSEGQMLLRLATRAAGRPLKATDEENPPVMFPTFIERDNGEPTAKVDFETRKYKDPLSIKQAWRSFQKFSARAGTDESLLKLSTHPNSSINVNGIKSIIQGWERDGWMPDIVCIDYADILAPLLTGQQESRNQIDATWKAMRSLSQSLHCLVVTATQSDAGSYEVETIDRSNFSEDKRKYAHVTAMIGINQTEEEKERGVQRLNYVARREGFFSERKCVHVAGSLAIARPCIISTF